MESGNLGAGGAGLGAGGAGPDDDEARYVFGAVCFGYIYTCRRLIDLSI